MLYSFPVSMCVLKTVVAEQVHAILTPHKGSFLLAFTANTLFYEDSRMIHTVTGRVRFHHAVIAENVVARGARNVCQSGLTLDAVNESRGRYFLQELDSI
jgi:hypothetical protein